MSSEDFTHWTRNHTDPDAAYTALVAEAKEQWGDNPYNGTISTTNGFTVAVATPLSLADAQDYAADHCDDYGKWEACGAIPLAAATPAVLSDPETARATFTLPGCERPRRDGVLDWLATTVRVPADQITITSLTTRPADKDRSVTITNAPGCAQETRYFVVALAMSRSLPCWDAGYPTLDDARAAVASTAEHAQASGSYQIIGITRASDGAALTDVEVRIHGWRVDVTYERRDLITPATTGERTEGWFFFGCAAT